MNRYALIAVLALFLAACGSGTTPPPVIDQQYAGPGASTGTVSATTSAAQTFTPAISGVVFLIEIHIGQSMAGGDLIVDIRPAPGGVPAEDDGLAMGTTVIPDGTYDAVAAWRTIGLTTPAPVAAGATYAITAKVTGTATYPWSGDDPGGYAGGLVYARAVPAPPGTWMTPAPTADFLFKEWVQP